jgi:amidase
MGRRAADADVIAASAAFERLRPWDYAIPAARPL